MNKAAFQVNTHSLGRLWPVKLFARNAQDDGYSELENLDMAADAILFNQGVYVYEIGVETQEAWSMNKLRFVKIKNLISIQGPIPYQAPHELSVHQVLSLSEAAKLWGLNDSSTLRKAMERDKFYESEVRKADSVWLVTYPAMQRVFEARTKKEIETEFYPSITIQANDGAESFSIQENQLVSKKKISPRQKYKLNEMDSDDESQYIEKKGTD
ncbi:helix-turn-helix domain-containing protein [Alkalihalobacterium sp. APHAB7]|uniref:helix-turn-helix domain-containing protein n=1 Tax=Alkalihalobacterium sp. APHAB7 TaxID=3402081 RepID=UPI003AAB6284